MTHALVVDAGGAVHAMDRDAALAATGSLIWVHLDRDHADTLTWLQGRAHLPDAAIDALTATETRPRCEAVGDGALVNLRGLSPDTASMSDPFASVRIYARGCRVISVARLPMNSIDAVCAEVQAGEIKDAGDLIAAFADAITAELDPVVVDLGDELDDCEEGIDQHRLFALRRAVGRARARAIGYRRFLAPQRDALERLAALPADWLAEDDRLHLAAAADRAARMAEELEAIRERAALLHETLTDLRAEQIDQRALIISIVAMVFLPLTFLTGLLGMNVEGIPYAREPWAFWGVVGICVILAVAIAAYFARRHWLRD
ncbi:zinc transporter ZntB [Sphingomonas sp. BGYR3]|uniref:zinc transporter ZntB n=1 Tax=Sphingomonas sp. BGYR3 TaxID=2975483 RepID=UPI0021A85DB7|nr:zinc transporter ZntB [Sphingomonas sp. BGYR3]MDG5488326.1 zinc transporter ZntB [Sphingomonas sp. BGYR3]